MVLRGSNTLLVMLMSWKTCSDLILQGHNVLKQCFQCNIHKHWFHYTNTYLYKHNKWYATLYHSQYRFVLSVLNINKRNYIVARQLLDRGIYVKRFRHFRMHNDIWGNMYLEPEGLYPGINLTQPMAKVKIVTVREVIVSTSYRIYLDYHLRLSVQFLKLQIPAPDYKNCGYSYFLIESHYVNVKIDRHGSRYCGAFSGGYSFPKGRDVWFRLEHRAHMYDSIVELLYSPKDAEEFHILPLQHVEKYQEVVHLDWRVFFLSKHILQSFYINVDFFHTIQIFSKDSTSQSVKVFEGHGYNFSEPVLPQQKGFCHVDSFHCVVYTFVTFLNLSFLDKNEKCSGNQGLCMPDKETLFCYQAQDLNVIATPSISVRSENKQVDTATVCNLQDLCFFQLHTQLSEFIQIVIVNSRLISPDTVETCRYGSLSFFDLHGQEHVKLYEFCGNKEEFMRTIVSKTSSPVVVFFKPYCFGNCSTLLELSLSKCHFVHVKCEEGNTKLFHSLYFSPDILGHIPLNFSEAECYVVQFVLGTRVPKIVLAHDTLCKTLVKPVGVNTPGHMFKYIVDGKFETFTDYEKIPDDIYNACKYSALV